MKPSGTLETSKREQLVPGLDQSVIKQTEISAKKKRSAPEHFVYCPELVQESIVRGLCNLVDDDAAAAKNASVENRWCQLRDTVQATALAVLGRAPRQHQDWFDDNDAAIINLLAEKNRLHKAYVDHPTDATNRRQLQQRLCEMQEAWTARKAEEIQGCLRSADEGHHSSPQGRRQHSPY
nr:unnamed protein product [Spirometra erinaceieuropaei]